MTAPESPVEQPLGESLRERCIDALDKPCEHSDDAGDWTCYPCALDILIPLVTADVQRQIAEALEHLTTVTWAEMQRPFGSRAAEFVRSLDLSASSGGDMSNETDAALIQKVRELHSATRPTWDEPCGCGMVEPYSDGDRVRWDSCKTVRIVYSAEEIALWKWLAAEHENTWRAKHAADQDAWFAKEAAARGWTPPSPAPQSPSALPDPPETL